MPSLKTIVIILSHIFIIWGAFLLAMTLDIVNRMRRPLFWGITSLILGILCALIGKYLLQ